MKPKWRIVLTETAAALLLLVVIFDLPTVVVKEAVERSLGTRAESLYVVPLLATFAFLLVSGFRSGPGSSGALLAGILNLFVLIVLCCDFPAASAPSPLHPWPTLEVVPAGAGRFLRRGI